MLCTFQRNISLLAGASTSQHPDKHTHTPHTHTHRRAERRAHWGAEVRLKMERSMGLLNLSSVSWEKRVSDSHIMFSPQLLPLLPRLRNQIIAGINKTMWLWSKCVLIGYRPITEALRDDSQPFSHSPPFLPFQSSVSFVIIFSSLLLCLWFAFSIPIIHVIITPPASLHLLKISEIVFF